MAININELKNKYNADMVYVNENDSIEKIGNLNLSDDVLKQVVVVLKQSLDTAECSDAKSVEFFCGDKKTVFIMMQNRVYGFVLDSKTSIIYSDLEETTEKEESDQGGSGRPKMVLKERQKITIKSAKKEPEKPAAKDTRSAEKESAAEEQVSSNLRADSNTLKDIKAVAIGYLDDFAEDIIDNLLNEGKVDITNPSQDDIDKFLKKLLKSASLIIGPSQANEMIGKIRKQITL